MRRALSSPILDDFRMLRYNRVLTRRFPPEFWRPRADRGHYVHMTGAIRSAIRTPDQRIRVFVSSTLRELAG